jgi:hypothetical protein
VRNGGPEDSRGGSGCCRAQEPAYNVKDPG